MIKNKHLRHFLILIIYFAMGFCLFKAHTNEVVVDLELAKAEAFTEIGRAGINRMSATIQLRPQLIIGSLTLGFLISPILFYTLYDSLLMSLSALIHAILSIILAFFVTSAAKNSFLPLYYFNQLLLLLTIVISALAIGLITFKTIINKSSINFKRTSFSSKYTSISLGLASASLNEETQAYLIDLVTRWQKKYSTIIVQVKILRTFIEIVSNQLIDKLNPFKSKTPRR